MDKALLEKGDLVFIIKEKQWAQLLGVRYESDGRYLYRVQSVIDNTIFYVYRGEFYAEYEVSSITRQALKEENNSKAKRNNKGKPELSQIDPRILEETAKVLMFGADKYGRGNWKNGQELSSICDSLLRHAYAFASGENNDQESGLSHLGHIVSNCMFALYNLDNGGEDER